MCVCVCVCVCIYTHRAGYRRICFVKFKSLWNKCELLWPTDSQYFWVTANQFRPIVNHF